MLNNNLEQELAKLVDLNISDDFRFELMKEIAFKFYMNLDTTQVKVKVQLKHGQFFRLFDITKRNEDFACLMKNMEEMIAIIKKCSPDVPNFNNIKSDQTNEAQKDKPEIKKRQKRKREN